MATVVGTGTLKARRHFKSYRYSGARNQRDVATVVVGHVQSDFHHLHRRLPVRQAALHCRGVDLVRALHAYGYLDLHLL